MMRWGMVGVDRANPEKAKGGKMVRDMNKFLRWLMRVNALQFSKGKLKYKYAINLPTAPNVATMHLFYSGNDAVFQGPATLK